jgi:hypothetical protein
MHEALRPRIVAVIAAGKLVHISEGSRIATQAARAPEIVAA